MSAQPTEQETPASPPLSPSTPASAPLTPHTSDPLVLDSKSEKGPFGDPTPPGTPFSSLSASRPQTATSSRPGHNVNGSLELPSPSFVMDSSGFSKRSFNARRRHLGNTDSGMSSQLLSTYSRAGSKAPRMKSHMLPEGHVVEKPWLEKKDASQTRLDNHGLCALFPRLCCRWCSVLLQVHWCSPGQTASLFSYGGEFRLAKTSAFGPNGHFMREVNMDGYGKNSYVKNGLLYMVPTFTAEEIGEDKVFNDYVYNITGCTFNLTRPDNGFLTSDNGTRYFDELGYTRACSCVRAAILTPTFSAVSNSTDPIKPIINPIQSARITTQNKTSIRFGRVEVRAKLASGDWLWPAIWLFPKDRSYGEWPRSGEIDMVESRGNSPRYTNRGSNYVQGSLNWGPSVEYNSVAKTYSWWSDKRHSFADDFHTYVLEWTETFMRIYVDTRVHTLLDIRFNKPFFERGDYPKVTVEDGKLVPIENPWVNGSWAAPFDQEFFLVMNLAVGGNNGWFPDGQGDKPWLNMGTNPMRDFISSKTQWMETWGTDPEARAMIV
ncbi:ectomycorrhiza-upregulated GH16 glucan endo-1,3-beta-glucosidase precursor [Flagelloscypha sp. PMI_526]|nr:ectomycorrhiza-upregulated GH16 glucan endo-1,3-beta-glucosidase precursor [Flagelloscypha sp. PMI_526]